MSVQGLHSAMGNSLGHRPLCLTTRYCNPITFFGPMEKKDKVFEEEFAKFSNNTDAEEYAFPIDLADYKEFARHFYELGKNDK